MAEPFSLNPHTIRTSAGPGLVFVTGASGLLGRAFVGAAAGKYPLLACHGRSAFSWPDVETVGLDLTNPERTEQLLRLRNPDIIVHLAADTQLDRCERFPREAFELNAGLTERLARWAAERGGLLIYMSTDAVFDGIHGAYTETDIPVPLNVYAASKLAGEQAIQKCGAEHLIIRGNIFGWNAQDKQSLAEWALAELKARRPFVGFSDVIFNPLFVQTLSNLLLALIDKRARGVVHVGSSDCVSKYEFFRLLAQEFGLSTEQLKSRASVELVGRLRRPLNTTLCCSRLENEFGISPPSIAQEIARFREQQDSGYVAKLKSSLLSP